MQGLKLLFLFTFVFLLFVFAEARLFSVFGVVPNFVLAVGFGVIFAILSSGYSRSVVIIFYLFYAVFVFFFWFLYLKEVFISLVVLAVFSLLLGPVSRNFVLDAVIASVLGTAAVLGGSYLFSVGRYELSYIIIEVVLNVIVTVVFYYLSRKLVPVSYLIRGDRLKL